MKNEVETQVFESDEIRVTMENELFVVEESGDSYYKSRGLFRGTLYKHDMHNCRAIICIEESEDMAEQSLIDAIVDASDAYEFIDGSMLNNFDEGDLRKEALDSDPEHEGGIWNGVAFIYEIGDMSANEDWRNISVTKLSEILSKAEMEDDLEHVAEIVDSISYPGCYISIEHKD